MDLLMAIIQGTRALKKEKIKVEINSDIMQSIEQYCTWANIDDVGFFIEEAACFVFSKDKEWKQHQKAIKKSRELA